MSNHTITVYRIEHRDSGLGAYRNDGGIKLSECDFYEQDFDKHPTPMRDSLLCHNIEKLDIDRYDWPFDHRVCDHCFGFATLQQLRSWFYDDKVLAWLEDNNFILAVCDVPEDDVIEGYSQVMFKKPKGYAKHSISDALWIK